MARGQSILADTSCIIALLDQDDRHHTVTVQIIQTATILVPSTVLPEVDYLVSKYLGEQVARAFLEDLTTGYFTYLPVDLQDVQQALEIMVQYDGVPLGLVDASLVALAERHQIQRILTLDRRHFSLIKPNKLSYLELLP